LKSKSKDLPQMNANRREYGFIDCRAFLKVNVDAKMKALLVVIPVCF